MGVVEVGRVVLKCDVCGREFDVFMVEYRGRRFANFTFGYRNDGVIEILCPECTYKSSGLTIAEFISHVVEVSSQ